MFVLMSLAFFEDKNSLTLSPDPTIQGFGHNLKIFLRNRSEKRSDRGPLFLDNLNFKFIEVFNYCYQIK